MCLCGGERGIEFTPCLLPEVTVPMSQFSDYQSLEPTHCFVQSTFSFCKFLQLFFFFIFYTAFLKVDIYDIGRELYSTKDEKLFRVKSKVATALRPSFHYFLLLLLTEALRTLFQRPDQHRRRLLAEIGSVAQFVDVVCELSRDLHHVVRLEILFGLR